MNRFVSLLLAVVFSCLVTCSSAEKTDQLKRKWSTIGIMTNSDDANEEIDFMNQMYQSGLLTQTEEYFDDYIIVTTIMGDMDAQETRYSYTIKTIDDMLLLYKGTDEKPYVIEFLEYNGLIGMRQTKYVGEIGDKSKGIIVFGYVAVE